MFDGVLNTPLVTNILKLKNGHELPKRRSALEIPENDQENICVKVCLPLNLAGFA